MNKIIKNKFTYSLFFLLIIIGCNWDGIYSGTFSGSSTMPGNVFIDGEAGILLSAESENGIALYGLGAFTWNTDKAFAFYVTGLNLPDNTFLIGEIIGVSWDENATGEIILNCSGSNTQTFYNRLTGTFLATIHSQGYDYIFNGSFDLQGEPGVNNSTLKKLL